MATKRIRMKRRATRRKSKQKRKTRKVTGADKQKRLGILAPLTLSNSEYSPVSSPGTSNTNTNNSPIKNTNTPITKRAKELARLYPTQRAMLNRSKSFNSVGLTTEEFIEKFGDEFGYENKPYFPEDHFTERYK